MAFKETYSIDTAQAERAIANLEKAQEKVSKETGETVKRLTAAEKAAKRLNEQADPTRRHARQMEELAKQVNAGRVNLTYAERLAGKYQRQLEGVGQAGKRAFGAGMLSSVSALATPVLSLASGLKAIREEMEAQQRLSDKRVASQLSVSQSRSVVRRNAISLSDAEIQALQRDVEGLANDTGVSEVQINTGLASTLSASGGKAKPALDATRIATRYLVDAPSNIGTVAGAFVDLGKVTGTDNQLANHGFLAAVGSAGRVVDPKQQAANIAPGIINALPYGGTGQGLGALTAALTFAGADTSGARTGTALPNLARQLKEYDLKDTTFAGDTTAERIRALQQSKSSRNKFLGGLSLDSKVGGLVIDLLEDPSSNVARAYAENFTRIPGNTRGLAALGEEAIRKLSVGNNLAPTAARERYLNRTLENFQTTAPSRRLKTSEIDTVKAILQEAGAYALGTDAGTFLQRLDGDGITTGEVVNSLRTRSGNLRRGNAVPYGNPGGGGIAYTPATDDDLAGADKLDRLVNQLGVLIETTEMAAKHSERIANAVESAPNPSEE